MAKKLQILGIFVILLSVAALFILIYNIIYTQNHIDNKKKVGTNDGHNIKVFDIKIKNENIQKACVDNKKLKITCDPKKAKLIPKDNNIEKNTNSKINKMIATNTKQPKNSDNTIKKQKRFYRYVNLNDKKHRKKTNRNSYKKIIKKVIREKKIRNGIMQSQTNSSRTQKESSNVSQFIKCSKKCMNGNKSSSSYMINTLGEVDQIKDHKILNENMIIKNVDNVIVQNKIKENLFCFEKKNGSYSDDITTIKRSNNNRKSNKNKLNNIANFCKHNGNHTNREETSFKGLIQFKMTKYKKQIDDFLTIRKEGKVNRQNKDYERINQTCNKKCINWESIDLIDYENLLENNKTYNFSINIKNKFFPSQNSDICKQYDLFIKSNNKLEKNTQNQCAECLFKYKNFIKHAIKNFNKEFIDFFGFKHAKKIEDRIISFTKIIENNNFFVNIEKFLMKVNYHKNSQFLRKHTLSNIYYQKHVFNMIFAMKTLLKTITNYKNEQNLVLDTNEVSYVNYMFRTLTCQDITQAYKYVYNIECKKTHKELKMVEIYFRPTINTLKLLSNRPKDEVLLIKDYFKNYLTQEILEMPIKDVIDVVDKFLTEHELNDKYKEDSDTSKYNYITYEIYTFRDYEEKCLAKIYNSQIYNI